MNLKKKTRILICVAAAVALAAIAAAVAGIIYLRGHPNAHAGPSPAPGTTPTNSAGPATPAATGPAAPSPSAKPSPEGSAQPPSAGPSPEPTAPPEGSAQPTAGPGDGTIVTGSGGSFTPGEMVPDGWFDDALFVGDSRTDGLRLYARAGRADYFVSTGLSVYTALTKTASDEDFPEQTLPSLLDSRTYGKVLICLGLNECGTNLQVLINSYRELVDTVRQKQPGAVIILQGVMACGRTKAQSNACFGPENINRLNASIKEMAAEAGARYIDPNTVFADSEGYLPDDLSGDGCHLHVHGYGVWMDWIRCQAVHIPVGPAASPAPETAAPPTPETTALPAPEETTPPAPETAVLPAPETTVTPAPEAAAPPPPAEGPEGPAVSPY